MGEIFDNSIRGVCEWACYCAELPFDKLRPDHVLVCLKDGREFTLGMRKEEFTGAEVLSIRIKHPDSKEIITIQVGARQ